MFNLDQSKILSSGKGLTKLKASADAKFNVVEMIICAFNRVENIVGKGGNAGNQVDYSKKPGIYPDRLQMILSFLQEVHNHIKVQNTCNSKIFAKI